MNFEDIPIKTISNEEETESTISNLMKQWPYIDETEIETETPISRPKWLDDICRKGQRQRRPKRKRCRKIRKRLTALCRKSLKVEEWKNVYLPSQLHETLLVKNYSFSDYDLDDLTLCVPSIFSSLNVTPISLSLDPTCPSPAISNSKANMTYQNDNILFLFLFLYALISFVRRIF